MSENTLYNKVLSGGSPIGLIIGKLGQYGSGWSLKNICQAIEQHNYSLKVLLSGLYRYGAYDILVAIYEIVDIYCTVLDIQWVDSLYIHNLDYERVQYLKKAFHIHQCRRCQYKGIEATPTNLLTLSVKQFESTLWKYMNSAYGEEMTRLDDRNICIWYPGLYDYCEKNEYIEMLSSHGFPYLITSANDILDGGIKDDILRALVRSSISGYLVELGVYYSNINDILTEVSQEESMIIAKADYYAYAQMIQKIYMKYFKHSLYISEKLIQQFEQMIRIAEAFGDAMRQPNGYLLKSYLPLFYQMIGRDEYAVTLLIDYIKNSPPAFQIRKEHLLVFYRYLLLTSDSIKRERLIHLFDEIYCNSSGFRDFRVVAEDILKFYKKYTKDLCKRIQLYEEWRNILWEEKNYWVFKEWFQTRKVEKVFKELLDKIYDMNDLHYVYQAFQQLFYGLTSHYDSVIRINLGQCIRFLGNNDECNYDEFYEVYGFYTKEEQSQLCILRRRMENTIPHMPAFWIKQLYEELRRKAENYWKHDTETILCEKLLTAFRGLQSNSYNNGIDENALNSLVAFFLRSYYGEANVHREEPQGLSRTHYKPGEVDIIIYKNDQQIAILEALKLKSLDNKKLNDHMNRLLVNYDTQGVPYTILIIYAYSISKQNIFERIEAYLKSYCFPYKITESIERVENSTATICHHKAAYMREGMIQRFHAFTILI